MKNLAIPALVALMVTSAGYASASDSVAGTVASIDQKANMFTLDNGQVYALQGPFNIKALTPGDKIVADVQDGTNIATWIILGDDNGNVLPFR